MAPVFAAITGASAGLTGLLFGAAAYIHVRSPHRKLFALRVFGGRLGSFFLIIGGVSMLAQNGGGLYWVVPALQMAMVAAIIGAWVVLVEAAR